MAINWIRGYRRIGWVATYPPAALIVPVFYENTKTFSPSNYEVIHTIDIYSQSNSTPKPIPTYEEFLARGGQDWFEQNASRVIELYGRWKGKAFFSREIPKDVAENIVKDFISNHNPSDIRPWEIDWSSAFPPPPGFVLGDSTPRRLTFSVRKQVDKLKLGRIPATGFPTNPDTDAAGRCPRETLHLERMT